MTKSIPALINPAVLSWARSFMGLDLEYAAERAGVDLTQLKEWEAGHSMPSIPQMRKLAKVYQFSISVFYLPEPPDIQYRRPKDRRFLHGYEHEGTPPELLYEFRRAEDRREIALQLLANIGKTPRRFEVEISAQSDPERVAQEFRRTLKVTHDVQTRWRNSRIAFNSWREKLESFDVLVFQSSKVPINAMRGYCIFFDVLPIIGVNRKDSYNARSFTLVHEAAHLMLRTGSLCDIEEVPKALNATDNRIEIFCNSVAGSALVPREDLLHEPSLDTACHYGDKGERAIGQLARIYSVSKEVIVRRLLSLGRISDRFYQAKREQYKKEYAALPRPSSGFVHPVENAMSTAGRPLIGLALENLNREVITTSDFSAYVGLKVKHIEQLMDGFLLA